MTWIDVAQDWDEWGTAVNCSEHCNETEGLIIYWEFLV